MSRAASFKIKRLAAADRIALLQHLESRLGGRAEAVVKKIEFHLATMRAPSEERLAKRESAALWDKLARAAAHLASFAAFRRLWENHWQVSSGLVDDLDRLERHARERADAQRGKPSGRWRDQLVAIVDHAYGSDSGSLRARRHRQRTIKMVLDFIGAPVKDLKSTLRDVRQRRRR